MYKPYNIGINKFIKEKHLNKLLKITNINNSFREEIIRFNHSKKMGFYTHFKFQDYIKFNFNLKARSSIFNDGTIFYIK